MITMGRYRIGSVAFPDKRFAELREDQQQYVQHLMASWRADMGPWFDPNALTRAIRKAHINRP